MPHYLNHELAQAMVTIAATVLAAQLAIFTKWIRQRRADDKIRRAFVDNMATNHLPHIYAALEQIADALGIALEEPPAVNWINRKKIDGE